MRELTSSQKLVKRLCERRWTVSAAESCTGGLVAKAITDVAGSSACFGYGFVTYSNEAKTALLGVDAALINKHGAVSEAVVLAMASGARQRAASELSVAISGVAGPGGGSEEKPVGTVWFAFASPDDVVVAERRQFGGDREAVRAASAEYALARLLTICESD